MIASMVVAKLGEDLPDQIADRIGERGGFDQLPAPVSPAAPTPPAAGSLAPPATETPDQPPEAPRRLTFAEKFRSRS